MGQSKGQQMHEEEHDVTEMNRDELCVHLTPNLISRGKKKP